MAELKPCEYCKEIPEVQRCVEICFLQDKEKYRVKCPRCNISTKEFYDEWGAIEAWNRRAEDGK